MRTDLVTAYLIHDWLTAHAPALADQWEVPAHEQAMGMAGKLKGILDGVEAQVTGQNMVAHNAIAYWGLNKAVLVAGGTPTPLSPKVDELLFWSDANADAVAEAEAAGYSAQVVDVREPDDLGKLSVAESLVTTGLFHFLPDEAAKGMFGALVTTDVKTIVFNHFRLPGDAPQDAALHEAIGQYVQLGISVYPRDSAMVETVIPKGWQITEALPQGDVIRRDERVGEHFADHIAWFDVYRIDRA